MCSCSQSCQEKVSTVWIASVAWRLHRLRRHRVHNRFVAGPEPVKNVKEDRQRQRASPGTMRVHEPELATPLPNYRSIPSSNRSKVSRVLESQRAEHCLKARRNSLASAAYRATLRRSADFRARVGYVGHRRRGATPVASQARRNLRMDLSGYTLAVLHQDGEFVLCRGRALGVRHRIRLQSWYRYPLRSIPIASGCWNTNWRLAGRARFDVGGASARPGAVSRPSGTDS